MIRKIEHSKNNQGPKIKRESTPAKERLKIGYNQKMISQSESMNIETELDILKAEKKMNNILA